MVPVSIRAKSEHEALGNRIAAMRAPLPVGASDPLERLRIVRSAMDQLKSSKQALGVEVILGLQEFAPPNLLAQAARINFSTRIANLIVTNVPGPQQPLYMGGRKLEQFVPVAALPANQTLVVAILSYNGRLVVSLLADWEAVPDIDDIIRCLEKSVAELAALARSTARKPRPRERSR
jgi:hypothetical protein